MLGTETAIMERGIDYRRWLAEFLTSLRERGRAILLTSHDPGRCRAIADRSILLRDSQLTDAEQGEESTEALALASRRAG